MRGRATIPITLACRKNCFNLRSEKIFVLWSYARSSSSRKLGIVLSTPTSDLGLSTERQLAGWSTLASKISRSEQNEARHCVVQSLVEGRRTRFDWIPCLIFATQEVSLAAPILGDLHMVLVKFDPDKVASEVQSHFSSSGRATERIENDASADRRKVGFPSHGYRLSWNVLPPGVLTPRLESDFLFWFGEFSNLEDTTVP